MTIDGGAGDDSISLSSSAKNNLIQYTASSGQDTIYGFRADSTLQIGDGTETYASLISDNDLIVAAGTGSITIVDAGSLSDINISGTPTGDQDLELVKNDTPSVVTSAAKNIISFGRSKPVYIVGNDKDNSILGGRGIDTLDGAAGNDTLTGGKGNDLFVYSAGADVITDYGIGGDVISLNGAAINDVRIINDNDVVLTFTGEDKSLTINDGYKVKSNNKLTKKNRIITLLEEKTTTSRGKTTTSYVLKNYVFEPHKIFNSNKSEIMLTADTTEFDATTKDNSKIKNINATAVTRAISIEGNKSGNKIYAGDNGSTLNGGAGNDTLTGGKGADVFVYAKNTGNDVIVNYTAGDVISLGSGAEITNVSLRKTDVVFKVGKKKLTVKESSTKEIALNENGTAKTYSGGLIYNADKTSATVTVAYPVRTKLELEDNLTAIDASLTAKGVNITGNSSGDTILGSAKKDTLIGGSGADSLSGGKGNDSMRGGAGNDILIGGKGNDTLWGDDGADTFIYDKGDGKDVILGFDGNDTLQISGTVDLFYNARRKEISVKVGSTSNAIALKNFGKTDTFHVGGSTWTLSDGVIKKS